MEREVVQEKKRKKEKNGHRHRGSKKMAGVLGPGGSSTPRSPMPGTQDWSESRPVRAKGPARGAQGQRIRRPLSKSGGGGGWGCPRRLFFLCKDRAVAASTNSHTPLTPGLTVWPEMRWAGGRAWRRRPSAGRRAREGERGRRRRRRPGAPGRTAWGCVCVMRCGQHGHCER